MLLKAQHPRETTSLSSKDLKRMWTASCNQFRVSPVQLAVAGTKVTCERLLPHIEPAMLKNRVAKPEMLQLSNRNDGRCARWCALVVLLAICSLTLSVATRYSSTERSSNSSTAVLQKHFSREPGRQRLDKNAANWIPPVIVSEVLQSPTPYTRVAPIGFVVAQVFFPSSLFYRPPPSLKSIF